MMNLDAIRKTTVCYWSPDDEAFVVESSLFDSLAGVGDTEEEAMQSFEDLLSDAFEAFHQGRVPKDKAGRPSKNTLPLNTDVKPETKEYIASLAKAYGCSQGEAIDFMALFHEKKVETGLKTKSRSPSKTIKAMGELIKSLEIAQNELKKAKGITIVGFGSFNKVTKPAAAKSARQKKAKSSR
jgi:predicted RNase H-like HicB family nuclease